MFGMAYAIDAIFLDCEGIAVGLVHSLKPWRVSRIFAESLACLELPAGTIVLSETKCGHKISID
jgi:uncharacterized membrane protein (UPF0127 family)